MSEHRHLIIDGITGDIYIGHNCHINSYSGSGSGNIGITLGNSHGIAYIGHIIMMVIVKSYFD